MMRLGRPVVSCKISNHQHIPAADPGFPKRKGRAPSRVGGGGCAIILANSSRKLHEHEKKWDPPWIRQCMQQEAMADPGFPRGGCGNSKCGCEKLLLTALFTKPPDGLPPYRMGSGGRSVWRFPIDIFPFCRQRPVTKELAALWIGLLDIFSQKLMKIKEYGPRGGAGPQPRSANGKSTHFWLVHK